MPNEKKRLPWRKILAAYAALLLLLGMAAVFTIQYFQRAQAHQVLREAKDVLLTLRLVGTTYYANGSLPVDMNRQSRLKKDAEAEVRSLTHAEGEFQILSWDENAYLVNEMQYTKGNYVALYKRQKDGSYRWQVLRFASLLEYEIAK